MKKTTSLLAITSTLVALAATNAMAQVSIPATETEKLAGRIQHGDLPGKGAGSMKMIDQSLPQPSVRVGPSSEEGVGLAYLLGFELDSEQANALMMGSKVELVVDVLKTDLGGPDLPLDVVFLCSGLEAKPEHFVHFGAWNNAVNLAPVGKIEADPEIGETRFDVTEILQKAPPVSTDRPMVFFAIYSPLEDLKKENAGRHVLFGGEGAQSPRLEITE